MITIFLILWLIIDFNRSISMFRGQLIQSHICSVMALVPSKAIYICTSVSGYPDFEIRKTTIHLYAVMILSQTQHPDIKVKILRHVVLTDSILRHSYPDIFNIRTFWVRISSLTRNPHFRYRETIATPTECERDFYIIW